MNDGSWWTDHPIQNMNKCLPNLIKRPRSTASVRHKSLFLENSFGFALNAGGSWTADLWIRKLCKQLHHLKIVQKSFKLNRSENSPRETVNVYSHANRERSCKWTTVIHRYLHGLRQHHAGISGSFFWGKRRSPRPRSRWRSTTRFLEHSGKLHMSESCCSENKTLRSKGRFSDALALHWCPETNENEHWWTSWGYHRWLAEHLKDKARFFVLVEAFHKALPQKSRRRQRNESTDRFIMFVPGVHTCALKNIQRCHGHSAESQKFARKPEIFWVAPENWIPEQSWSATSRMSSTTCACTNKDTRNPTWRAFDRMASETWTSVELSYGRAYYRSWYNVVQPHQGGGSDTIKAKEHPEYEQVVQW